LLFFFIADVKELEKGMELTKRELGNRLNTPMNATTTNEQQRLKQEQNQILQNFVDRANDLVIKLKTDSSNAQTAFKECADYYGEDSKSAHCNTFFGYFVRFMSTWKACVEENEKKRKKEMELMRNPPQNSKNNKPGANMQMVKNDLISELRSRNSNKPKPYVKTEAKDLQDGMFEQIITDMKSHPFRTGQYVDRKKGSSFRRDRRSDNMAISSHETEPL
jgi:Fe2+ transport system protein B